MASTLEQTLIVAVSALGGSICTHVFARFTESHKATVGLSAKRKERFYDKQATVVAGMYERLARLVQVINHMATQSSPNESDIAKALDLFNECRQYFEISELYFPETEAATIRTVIITMRYPVFAMHNYNVIGKTPFDFGSELTKIRETVSDLMEQLQNKFRQLMLGEEHLPPKTLWQRFKKQVHRT
jgi:hypothetical protein